MKSSKYSPWAVRCLLLATLLICTLAAGALADQPVCSHCGKKITGKYYEFERARYHDSCYLKYIAPRCGVCNQPVGREWVVYEGKTYHESCYNRRVALRCSHCGGTIEGEYFFDFWGNVYHPRHAEELGSCRFCGRLLSEAITGGGHSTASGHMICNDCSREVITDVDVGRRMLNQIRDRMVSLGIEIAHEDIEFDIVSPEKLAELMDEELANHLGLTQYRQTSAFLGLVEGREFNIYMLNGLPKTQFIATAAHELMHVWLYLYGRPQADDALIEGSCNYVSAMILSDYDDDMARYVLRELAEDSDPIYGDGYRRVRKLVENRGLPFLLQHLKFDPEFPIGY